MNSDCAEGLQLRRHFEKELKEWGWFDAFEKAVENIPVGLSKVSEFQAQVKSAESALFKARYPCEAASGKRPERLYRDLGSGREAA